MTGPSPMISFQYTFKLEHIEQVTHVFYDSFLFKKAQLWLLWIIWKQDI